MVYILKTTEEINILTCTYAYLLKKRTRVSTIWNKKSIQHSKHSLLPILERIPRICKGWGKKDKSDENYKKEAKWQRGFSTCAIISLQFYTLCWAVIRAIYSNFFSFHATSNRIWLQQCQTAVGKVQNTHV